jgi:hypothetical protein
VEEAQQEPAGHFDREGDDIGGDEEDATSDERSLEEAVHGFPVLVFLILRACCQGINPSVAFDDPDQQGNDHHRAFHHHARVLRERDQKEVEVDQRFHDNTILRARRERINALAQVDQEGEQAHHQDQQGEHAVLGTADRTIQVFHCPYFVFFAHTRYYVLLSSK